MKKVMFIKVDKGVRTPESKAEALRKCGHLVAIVEDPMTGNKIKYYTTAALSDYDLCAEVTIRGGRVVSVRKVSKSILHELIIPDAPMFGGF